uniref:ADF-H domain-containing protein n=1 Tax=Eutreptiella gymnastica TaxID=73025 RepID=A0A7S4GJL4_9EUGL|mmetsp:Transcript_44365/g.74666  ORF Transcript_44365/g.74666 Transcript_44365/m.74666 type:complete len:140 (-) Transcript_44365:233-652(-)|eukprot:CAMPEP_0174285136 /NCGR_PEP_ID=MMETSP0809-20121228/7748_1 /TAXON_ID=73025 ORGANISM="Eutreptiella gymnastica-like, Strain CCMP1594" /NCGR_SAMPLE_ID=MMETSP0809 /ASSEMBLY_ACC=CAM_ASM_000658 /LENGTH=139 /DNA_ID=CAMNT_0015380829 /DNA_START=58 /DNA_END=477 /DNA_ORIENTATION=-
MSKSGVEVSDDVIKAFNDMKLNRTHRYLSVAIKDKKEIFLEKASSREETYAELFANIPNEPRYYIVDFEFELQEGEGSRSKLVFMYWCPDTAKVGEKMLYASSKESLKRKLEGVFEVQANDKGDADEQYIISKLKAATK